MSSNPVFRFKRFAVWQDRTAMKVGTDGVLLGCLAKAAEGAGGGSPLRILDIGAGTGLVSIMLAQRYPKAQVTGVQVDPEAAGQAAENCSESPFADRLTIVSADIKDYAPTDGAGYDLIVSNPPYFTQSLQCPDGRRNMARHAVGLTLGELAAAAARLLNDGGRVAIILPHDAAPSLAAESDKAGLTLTSKTTIFSTRRKPPRRAVCHFMKKGEKTIDGEPDVKENELTLLNPDGSNTTEYQELAIDFYLDR